MPVITFFLYKSISWPVTGIQINHLIHFLKSLFKPKKPAKTSLTFSETDIAAAVRTNRSSLALIETWIDENAFAKSWFQYGVPDYIKKEIDKPIDIKTTYTDLLLVVARKYFPNLNYLEIGVSVGKNFFQLLQAVEGAVMTGFDIEDFNPIVENKLVFNKSLEWKTPDDSIKKSVSSLKSYSYHSNQVHYLCADIWDRNSWAKLEGNKFNLIFSDALHSPEAILFEFEMLVKYNLLDRNFVIVWDDLVGKMKSSFFKIIRKYDAQFDIRDIFLIRVNGWVGEFEIPHSVGIISNFNLR